MISEKDSLEIILLIAKLRNFVNILVLKKSSKKSLQQLTRFWILWAKIAKSIILVCGCNTNKQRLINHGW